MNRRALLVLAAAQFVMVLDSAVMNVSISQLVEDFDTSVTTIQAVITFYALVMAALMITGGKVGDLIGRRRAFTIGLAIYACGSGLTAIAPTVGVLILGWSVLEGIGAALVLPALAALVSGNFEGEARAKVFGVLGGVAGAGVAVGPILGGWVTANLTWRYVFVGEVIVVIAILLLVGAVEDAPRAGERPELDVVGAVLCASGIAVGVYGVLQSSSWGWITPRNSPVEPFGFSATLFVIALGVGLLAAFAAWQRRREAQHRTPLVALDQLQIPSLRAGLSMALVQNLILMGIFFTIPLYLQVVQGFDAFETGLRMLPVSITLLVTSMSGPVLAARLGPRAVVRVGLVVLLLAALVLLSQVEPEIDGLRFGIGMAVLGIGMGLVVSQLGNVVQGSVGPEARSEAGGLQQTSQQLGAALGTALMGAVVIGSLTTGFGQAVAANPDVSAETRAQVSVALQAGVSFIPLDQVDAAATAADLPAEEVDALLADYGESQLQALKLGLLVAALLASAGWLATRHLPARPLGP
jgi:EmrB/QacA subfamily drug resistance transporter